MNDEIVTDTDEEETFDDPYVDPDGEGEDTQHDDTPTDPDEPEE